jgi:hypothetical protein
VASLLRHAPAFPEPRSSLAPCPGISPSPRPSALTSSAAGIFPGAPPQVIDPPLDFSPPATPEPPDPWTTFTALSLIHSWSLDDRRSSTMPSPRAQRRSPPLAINAGDLALQLHPTLTLGELHPKPPFFCTRSRSPWRTLGARTPHAGEPCCAEPPHRRVPCPDPPRHPTTHPSGPRVSCSFFCTKPQAKRPSVAPNPPTPASLRVALPRATGCAAAQRAQSPRSVRSRTNGPD